MEPNNIISVIYLTDSEYQSNMAIDISILKKLGTCNREKGIDTFFTSEEFHNKFGAVKIYCSNHTIPFVTTPDSFIDAFLCVRTYTQENPHYHHFFQFVNLDYIHSLKDLYRKIDFDVRLV